MLQHCLRHALVVALASSGIAVAQPPADPQAAAALPTGEPEVPQAVGLWIGHVESDNIARAVIPEDGSYEALGLLVDLGQRSRRLTADLDADLEYRDYSLDTVDSELVGTLNASAQVAIVQDRFSWTFADYFGQGITDPHGGIGPGNREQINLVSTGPRLNLAFGSRTSLDLTGTVSRHRFEESNSVDTDSVNTELGLHQQMSPTARLGLVLGSDNVEYVDAAAPEYDIDRLAVRYEKELATGRVRADIGTNEISTAGFKEDGPLYNLVWTRSLTDRSDLSVRAGRGLTNSGGVLISSLAPGLEGESFPDVVVSSRPLEHSRVGASYLLTLSRTTIAAEIGSSEEEYVGNSALDNDSTELHVAFVRTITPRLNLGIGHDTVERDFVDGSQPDGEDAWTVAWVNRTLGRRLFLGFAISKYDRSPESYDEQRYELRFGYSPTESGVASMTSVGR